MKIRSAFLIVALYLFFPLQGMAQRCLVENFDKENGLSNNNVKSVLQDSDGCLWLGTRSGLDRYDGYHFEHISIQGEDSPRISVYSLWEDGRSRIWMATSRGLFYYDVPSGTGGKITASFNELNYVTGTPDGELWVVEHNGGLWRVSSSDFSYERQDVDCKFLTIDNCDGSLYCVTHSDSLYVRRNGSAEFERYPCGLSTFLESGKIYSLNCAGGKLFIGSLDGNIILDLRTGRHLSNALPLINQVVRMPSGDTWLATKHGVYVLDSEMNVRDSYFKDAGASNSIIDNYTISIAADKDLGVWVGTYFAGLSHMVPNKSGLSHYFPGKGSGGSCNVREIIQDAYSNVWIGTNADGLYRLSVDGRLQKYPLGVSCKNILGLFVDGDTLWIGLNSDNDPLLSLDLVSGRIHRYYDMEAKAYTFCRSDRERIWIGGEEGLHVCHLENGELVQEKKYDIHHIRRIFKDTFERIWVASNSGIHVIESSDPGSVKSVRMQVEGYVSDVFEDSSGGIWTTTDGGELLRFDESEGGFARVGIPSEYQCDKLFRIVQDAGGTLWVTSSSGMLAFLPGQEESMVLIPNESLSISNFNYSSNYYSHQGLLYAGTTDGFISFDPKSMLSAPGVDAISLTSFVVLNTLGGESRPFSKKELQNGGRISLPSSQNSFEVRVSDFDYGFPQSGMMMYQLEGFSAEWQKLSGGVIKVSSLPSGKYTLRIRHYGSEETRYSLIIEIQRPFVLSFPFIAILLVSLAIVVSLIIRKERHNALAAARKAADEESRMREVENEKKLYASKVEFLSTIAHEIKTPLMLISLPVKSLRDRLGKTVDKSLEDDVEIIDKNAERLSSLIDDLLDFGQMETTEYKLDLEEIDVGELTKKIFERFALSAKKKHVDFNLEMHRDKIVFSTDKGIYEKLLGNLFSNALKYCASYVIVELDEKYGEFVLSVTNDGEIVPETQRSQIFKPFVRYSGSSVNPVPGTGIGLYTSANFASLMGGNLEMDEDMSVNRFVLSLPVTHQQPKNTDSGQEGEGYDENARQSDTTVMLVEDDEDMRSFLSRQLGMSFNVIITGNGQEAIDLLEQGEMPNIIISDVIMPQVDGYELCRYVKSNMAISHIPVILLTAVTTKESHIQGLDVGADAYLQKPVSVEILLTTIRNILQNRKNLLDHFMTDPASSLAHSGLQPADVLFLRHLQEYINEHLDNPDLKNKDVAGAMCVSSSALFKKVKDLTGMSPMEYLQRARLNKAADLLSAGGMSITNVCYASGFNTPSYFTMVFKRRFGMTPREWVDKAAGKQKENA